MPKQRYLRWFFASLVALVAQTARGAEPAAVKLSSRTTVEFADARLGQELITRRDDFTKALSRFDLQSRLKTDKDVALDDLLQLYRDNVTAWPAEDAAAVTKALEFVRDRLREYEVPWPETVYFVRTTGKEESGAAYCRGPSVILPQNLIRQNEAGLQRLVAHELFHVLSSHNPELRTDLYAIIGFTTCDPIAVPKSLRERTIANPDAPRIDCTMEIEVDGEKFTTAPLLVSSADSFDPAAGKSMFQYLQFRLMAVEKHDGQWRAVEKDGAAPLIDPRKNDSFWKQIGRNTGYVIHPDEVMAENFSLLVLESERLPSPEIVAKLRARLKSKP
jgi:hypothetical protein